MATVESAASVRASWWVVHAQSMGSGLRLLFGVIWLIDGSLKFTSGFVSSFPTAVQNAAANAPAWLSGWYAFWVPQADAHAPLIVDGVGALEVALGLALLLGFLRKLAFLGGIALSLLIWAVPEGFGGPYNPGGGGTDVGTGVIYVLVFLGLIIIDAAFGPHRWTLDAFLERRFPVWRKVAGFGDTLPRAPLPRPT